MDEEILTQEMYDKLKEELEFLKNVKREDIKQKVKAAREEGDLKENGGYHAAREAQGKNEAQIIELTARLKNARITKTKSSTNQVSVLNVVTAKIMGNETRFLLANKPIEEEIPVYTDSSPIGKAILGKKVGETVTYNAPNGNKIEVQILKIESYTG